MCVAGIAMGLAVFSLWAAQHWGGRNQWGIIYIVCTWPAELCMHALGWPMH